MTNEELQQEMIAAMKAKDKVRLSIIRQVKAEVKNIEVNERRDVTEEDVNSMIKRLIKQTSETLEMSIKAGTDQERTDNLTEQVKILESLLPAQVSGEELEALIEQVIAELGATSKKQMGQVMGALGKATGATTRMCLAALEHCAGAGKTVLDLGCGSGILGIGALLLGCAHVTGCDIDPKAPEVAAGNAALNGFADDRFTVCAGDILADAGLRRDLGTGYDLVLANIVSDVIIPLAAHAPAFLAPGGTFICSGIIDGREDEVRAAIERAGFTVTAHDSLEEWHCFTATLA